MGGVWQNWQWQMARKVTQVFETPFYLHLVYAVVVSFDFVFFSGHWVAQQYLERFYSFH